MGLVYSAAEYRYVTVSGGATNLNTKITANFRIRDLNYNATPRTLAAVTGMNAQIITETNTLSFRNIPYAGFRVYAFDSATERDPANAVGVGIVPGMPLANDFTSGSNNTYAGWVVYDVGQMRHPTTGARLVAGEQYWFRVQAIDVMQKPVRGADPAVNWGGDSPISTEVTTVASYPFVEVEATEYDITYGPFTNGRVTGPATAAAEELVQLTVVPATGYRLTAGSLMVNGVLVQGTSFVMPSGPVTVTARFQRIPTGIVAPPSESDIRDLDVPLSGAANLAYELYLLGLFRGTGTDADGEPIFGLEQSLTRLQALILTIRLLGLEEEALAFEGENPFTDVTAASQVRYVAYGYAMGITTGVTETLFRPTRLVSLREFTTFLLRVLGYDDREGDFEYAEAIAKAVDVLLYSEELAKDLSDGEFLRNEAVIAMGKALLTFVNGSEEIRLIDKLVEAEVFSQEKADAFIEVMAKIEEMGF